MDTASDNHLEEKVRLNDNGPVAEVKPDLEKLRAYTQTKLFLAEQMRVLREALTALGREESVQRCGELLVKLAEDRFTLAVVGQFKRGKSSLMNAIIGCELLPTGVLPLTSAVTVLKYGATERLVVRREKSLFPDELPVSALADYVTEQGNPSNQKKVKAAYVELPVPFLRRGVEFVDTPGVGSAITANTVTTYEFLPECDAVLFVTSVDTPLTSLELAFLQEIWEYVDRIFFVVNKIDLVADGEREEVMKFVADTIRKQSGGGEVKVFPVSARKGLDARMSGDLSLYKQSGIKALEEALAAFLSEEKAVIFLAAVVHKALQIINEEAERGFLGEGAIQALVQEAQEKTSGNFRSDPQAAAVAVRTVWTKLEALYEGLLGKQLTAVQDDEFTPSAAPQPGAAEAMADAPDISSELEGRGCPVCRHMEKYTLEFFSQWQYQISVEEQAQAAFAAELGFCPLHTWQLLALSSPHGTSVGYARLVEQTARRLRRIIDAPVKRNEMRNLVRDFRRCRVCGALKQVEREYIGRLVSWLDEATTRSRYSRSQGVCLRHLCMLLPAVSMENQNFLLSHAAQRFEENAEDMRSYAMKHEAVRRALQNRDEEDAYRRAIIHLVGERYVCVPWIENERM